MNARKLISSVMGDVYMFTCFFQNVPSSRVTLYSTVAFAVMATANALPHK